METSCWRHLSASRFVYGGTTHAMTPPLLHSSLLEPSVQRDVIHGRKDGRHWHTVLVGRSRVSLPIAAVPDGTVWEPSVCLRIIFTCVSAVTSLLALLAAAWGGNVMVPTGLLLTFCSAGTHTHTHSLVLLDFNFTLQQSGGVWWMTPLRLREVQVEGFGVGGDWRGFLCVPLARRLSEEVGRWAGVCWNDLEADGETHLEELWTPTLRCESDDDITN